jgi:hypothetical protein
LAEVVVAQATLKVEAVVLLVDLVCVSLQQVLQLQGKETLAELAQVKELVPLLVAAVEQVEQEETLAQTQVETVV